MAGAESGEDAFEAWRGRVIDGRYRLRETLGEGGMGAVFVAEHLGLKKDVALKIVRPEHAGNAGLAARFAREAMVTSRIEHPNVISALDFGTLEDGTAFLVTQLVRGESLSKLVEREGALPWGRAADLGAQIADALCAAKEHGIVHRDLKPENVLVQRRDDTGGDLVKVLDFGIAKYARDSMAPPPMMRAQQVTHAGMVIGTPGYMAPEQAIGQRADHRADLYALGVLLWECIVGHRLWQGDEPREIITNQLKGTPPLLRSMVADPSLPDELERLVAALLAAAPSQRPDNPQLIRDALREISLQARTLAQAQPARRATTAVLNPRPTRPMRPAGEPLPPRQTTPFTTERPPPSNTGRNILLGVLTATVLLTAFVLVASGFVSLFGPDGPIAVRPLKELAPRLASLRGKARGWTDTDANGTGLPPALEPQLEQLVQGATRDQRVAAARALLGHIPIDETPDYVRALAHFQLAETCADKRDPLENLRTLMDRRALPALVLTSERAKVGCGSAGSRKDCLACMRPELEALIDELESSGPKTHAGPN